MDYGKFLYQASKKHQSSRKNQKQMVNKEVKLRPQIDVHDLEVKFKRIEGFIESGCRVKVGVFYRGREAVRLDKGDSILKGISDRLKDVADIESEEKRSGFLTVIYLVPRSSS